MTLGFSTQINGKETFFVEKIWQSFQDDFTIENFDKFCFEGIYTFSIDGAEFPAKVHTIRQDKSDRWKAGVMIDFFINVRTENMFRFAPKMPVLSTQKVEIIYKQNTQNLTCLGITYDRTITVNVDDKFYGDAYLINDYVVSSSYMLEFFALNDGFDSVEDFCAYFNQDFIGKIIHWTDLKY